MVAALTELSEPGQPPVAINLRWAGPYGWPRETSSLTPLDHSEHSKHGGVYLQAIPYKNGGYIILGAGHTGRPFAKRFAEHKREYLKGNYNVLDIECLRNGKRSEVWHGWREARRPERRAEFDHRRDEIVDAALEQIRWTSIFVVGVEIQRLRERIEAAIMQALYAAERFQDIPARGYYLRPRYDSEVAIVARNHCEHVLHCLPAEFII